MQARRTDPLRPGVFVRAAGALIASARRLNPSKHLESRTGRPGKNKVQVVSLNTRGFNGPGGRGARGGSLGGSMSHGIPWNPRPPWRPGYECVRCMYSVPRVRTCVSYTAQTSQICTACIPYMYLLSISFSTALYDYLLVSTHHRFAATGAYPVHVLAQGALLLIYLARAM